MLTICMDMNMACIGSSPFALHNVSSAQVRLTCCKVIESMHRSEVVANMLILVVVSVVKACRGSIAWPECTIRSSVKLRL